MNNTKVANLSLTISQTLANDAAEKQRIAALNNHDGCGNQYQNCTCGNTGLRGACNYGPHKSGLYCRC